MLRLDLGSLPNKIEQACGSPSIVKPAEGPRGSGTRRDAGLTRKNKSTGFPAVNAGRPGSEVAWRRPIPLAMVLALLWRRSEKTHR